MSYILITGGAGYIGSHICLKLLEAGYTPLVLDNLTNGHRDAVHEAILIEGDLRDARCLRRCFKEYEILAVIHMAGLIEAGLSMTDPAPFYENNTTGSWNLLEAMREASVTSIVFSSTAALYGNHKAELLDENLPVAPINPYGKSKAMVETMLGDYSSIYCFKAIALRYFNAAGADPRARLGERHNPESHLIPLALQTAAGTREEMKIFGNDYMTLDGTCVRDYIHVDDLASAHIKALEWLLATKKPVFEVVNIGTGRGHSVKEILNLAQDVSGCDFPIQVKGRRPGDPDSLVADVKKAEALLNWRAKFIDPREIVEHAWAFEQMQHPKPKTNE